MAMVTLRYKQGDEEVSERFDVDAEEFESERVKFVQSMNQDHASQQWVEFHFGFKPVPPVDPHSQNVHVDSDRYGTFRIKDVYFIDEFGLRYVNMVGYATQAVA